MAADKQKKPKKRDGILEQGTEMVTVKISAPLNVEDFAKFKDIAAKADIPYTTIIKALIDNYDGKVVEVPGPAKLVNFGIDKGHFDRMTEILDGLNADIIAENVRDNAEYMAAKGKDMPRYKKKPVTKTAELLRSIIHKFVNRKKPREYDIIYKVTL